MKILNKEYGLLLTVAAAGEISAMCPGGELSNLGKSLLFSKEISESTDAAIAFICALSKGYEASAAFANPDYVPEPVTPELLAKVTLGELWQARAEAIAAFNAGLNTTVDVDDAKKNINLPK